jgi:cell division transport system ATP-binding protein
MNGHPLIYLSNVSVYREKILVLSNLSLKIDVGEFVYLIGKTGSGKSTLLKTLYAELLPEDGEAKIAKYNLASIKQKEIPFLRRKLGIVFQDFQLLFDRTVNHNLEFVMKATGWKDKEKIEKRSHEVLEMVGMPVKGFKMPHELSGGEQQRVCIARALINQPHIILADEPTGNLDPETSAEIISLLHQINKTGTTVILATHNHQMIEKFPARVVQMERGSIARG